MKFFLVISALTLLAIPTAHATTSEINRLDSEGIGLIGKQDYRGAIAKFDQSLKLNPKNPRALANRGFSNMNLDELDRAYEDFEKSRALAPDYSKPLSANYAELAYRNTGKQNYMKCITVATIAIQLDPKLANGYADRGGCHSALTHFKEALSDLNRAIELEPKLAPAYINRAGVRAGLGDCPGAKSDAQIATRLDPSLRTVAPQMLESCR
ncbi:MAG: tetratricopeptide repeat protein [Bdellovibrionota bacterium]